MSALIEARFEYWMTAGLIVIGFYGMLGKRNLVKKLIGLNIVQAAVVLFFVSFAVKTGGTIPILPHHSGAHHPPEIYMSPLPHVLMLTAIVVMVSTTGVAFALLIRIYRHYGTLDEERLLGRSR